eukprot:g11407.t1
MKGGWLPEEGFYLSRGDGGQAVPGAAGASATGGVSFFLAALVFALSFYVSMVVLLQKAFVALIIEQFLLVKVSFDLRPVDAWDTQKIIHWAVPGIFVTAIRDITEKVQAKLAERKGAGGGAVVGGPGKT